MFSGPVYPEPRNMDIPMFMHLMKDASKKKAQWSLAKYYGVLPTHDETLQTEIVTYLYNHINGEKQDTFPPRILNWIPVIYGGQVEGFTETPAPSAPVVPSSSSSSSGSSLKTVTTAGRRPADPHTHAEVLAVVESNLMLGHKHPEVVQKLKDILGDGYAAKANSIRVLFYKAK